MIIYKTKFKDGNHTFNIQNKFIGLNEGVVGFFYKDGNNNFVRKYRYIRNDIDLLTKYTEEFNDKYFL